MHKYLLFKFMHDLDLTKQILELESKWQSSSAKDPTLGEALDS